MCRVNLQPFALLCPPALPTQEVHWGVAKTFASWVRFLLCLLNYYCLLLSHDRLNHIRPNQGQKSHLSLNAAARAAAPDQNAEYQNQNRLASECPQNYQ